MPTGPTTVTSVCINEAWSAAVLRSIELADVSSRSPIDPDIPVVYFRVTGRIDIPRRIIGGIEYVVCVPGFGNASSVRRAARVADIVPTEIIACVHARTRNHGTGRYAIARR